MNYKIYKKLIEQNTKPTFKEPTLDNEYEELERTHVEKLIDLKKLIHGFLEKGELEALTEEEWKSLENSDSYGVNGLDEIRNILSDYGKNRLTFDSLNKAFDNGEQIEAPTVLFLDEEPPDLIGGNSRLMFCRVKDIKPMVYKIRMSREDIITN